MLMFVIGSDPNIGAKEAKDFKCGLFYTTISSTAAHLPRHCLYTIKYSMIQPISCSVWLWMSPPPPGGTEVLSCSDGVLDSVVGSQLRWVQAWEGTPSKRSLAETTQPTPLTSGQILTFTLGNNHQSLLVV